MHLGSGSLSPEREPRFLRFGLSGHFGATDEFLAIRRIAFTTEAPAGGDAVAPGLLSEEDLASYKPVFGAPVRTRFGEYEVVGMPMPYSGGATLGLMFHLAEADGYSKHRRMGIDAVRDLIGIQNLALADRNRNIIAMTSTIEQHFGCALVVPGRGFRLNNQLTDFDADREIVPSQPSPNAPAGEKAHRRTALGEDAISIGGKRPRSSMTPTLTLRDGRPILAIGCWGYYRFPVAKPVET